MSILAATRRRLAAVLLAAASCVLLTPVGAAGEEFDRSFQVPSGARLDVRLFGGEVVVRGWERDRVRVRATHFKTDTVDARLAGGVVTVRARASAGPPHAIDVTIDVPTWMPLTIAGTYVDISVTGSRASVSAETVRGDVRVRGGAGTITLKSIEGEVTLDAASGRATLTAVNNGIRVAGFGGELQATTVNGNVTLEGVRSSSVDVGTVGGDIRWSGAIPPSARYAFATHTGDIDVSLGPQPSTAVAVRAFDGQFRSAYPVKLPREDDRKKRFAFVLGAGSARLELETFRGTISLRQ
jgi:hypothetical protein